MAKLGLGYGSEFHLMRFLGRHRHDLDSLILKEIDYQNNNIEWKDFLYDQKLEIPDREYIGTEFLKNEPNFSMIEKNWTDFWPSKKHAQNWDAIGKIGNEWLLVEAKAKKDEIISTSQASPESLKIIKNRMDDLKNKYNIQTTNDWTKKYYQKANRILFFNFLKESNIQAKLIFVYFINGYLKNGIQEGIASQKEWLNIIKEQDAYLGIENNELLKKNIVNVFIDVYGNNNL
jgi:hypothetical protein